MRGKALRFSFAEAADCGVAVPKVPLTGLPE